MTKRETVLREGVGQQRGRWVAKRERRVAKGRDERQRGRWVAKREIDGEERDE
jgi:hypothetical protein